MTGDMQNTIQLYSTSTSNGIKVSILLEELGLKYDVHKVDLTKGEQKSPSFLEINPNGRIPALTDVLDGQQIRLFESGSILQYLISIYDKDYRVSYPPGTSEYFETNNWLFFQHGGIGPMKGQANFFMHYSPVQVPFAIARYRNETRRLYGVLDDHLRRTNTPYLVGDKCTVADIANWPWCTKSSANIGGIDLEEFPMLQSWDKRMLERPAVEKGRHVPEANDMDEFLQDPEKLKAYAELNKKWIVQGMEKDAEDRRQV